MKQISIAIEQLQLKYGDEEALRIAKRIGADAVDFSLCMHDVLKPESIYSKSDDEIKAYFSHIKDIAEKTGIKIGQTHGRVPGFKDIPEEDNILLENARRDFIATAALGAPVCVTHAVTTIFMGPDAPRKKMHALNFDMFTKILPYAKENNIIIATETFGDAVKFNSCDFFGNINEFIITYNKVCAVKDFEKYFKICVDTGHSNKAMRFGNPTPADVIRMLGKNIVALHLNDNDTFTDQHKIPRTGTIDWDDVLNALDEIGYDGIYNMELALSHFGKNFEIEEAEFAIKVMRKMLKDHYGE